MLRMRLTAALRHKATRGELRQPLPVGLDYDDDVKKQGGEEPLPPVMQNSLVGGADVGGAEVLQLPCGGQAVCVEWAEQSPNSIGKQARHPQTNAD